MGSEFLQKHLKKTHVKSLSAYFEGGTMGPVITCIY